MLNNVATDFEEKRAFIASTLSLTDLLKPGSEYRGGGPGGGPGSQSTAQFTVSHYPSQMPSHSSGYVVQQQHFPPSLLKPNQNGYNVNFLNNGVPDKDLGKLQVTR